MKLSLHRADTRRYAAVTTGAMLVLCTFATGATARQSHTEAAPSPAPVQMATPLAARVLDAPNPVLGADNRMHLVYEIQLSDLFPLSVKLNSVQAFANRRPIGEPVTGARLVTELRIDSATPGTTIPAGGGAIVFMDVTYPRWQATPARLTHAFSISYQIPAGPRTSVRFVGVPTAVDQRPAIMVVPPLRGARWVDFNGCCATITSHRGAIEPIDGTTYVPERFAIDFAQLNVHDRLFKGRKDKLSSYAYFGAPVHSVADGTVVSTHDGEPEQVPGQGPLPGTVTVQNAGGNYIVIKIAKGVYAYYAHLQPGSLRVKKGQHVTTGQVIGLLGNSGNTTAPHLHFHLMNSPSPLTSNGLPYTFTSFRGNGVVTSDDPIFAGKRAHIDPTKLAGPHHGQLPLNAEVLNLE